MKRKMPADPALMGLRAKIQKEDAFRSLWSFRPKSFIYLSKSLISITRLGGFCPELIISSI